MLRESSIGYQAGEHICHQARTRQDSGFGLAKVCSGSTESDRAETLGTYEVDPEHLTSPGSTLGTARICRPNKARVRELDGRSDLFSFGTVLYEMATGRLPFRNSC
jgi:eukaryotic-like serine/threonine-protein kinase